MFVPDPADHVVPIILVFSQPELALFADNIEDLESHYYKLR